MNIKEAEIKDILGVFLQAIDSIGYKGKWRIAGSLNVVVQGPSWWVDDIDIIVDNELQQELRKYFETIGKYSINDFYKDDLGVRGFQVIVNNVELEIGTFDNEDYNAFDKVESVMWQDMILNIFPLQFLEEFYIKTNREEKAEAVRNYYEEN